MINIKQILLLLVSFCLFTVTTACKRTYDYSFAQSIDAVEKVEICTYDYDTKSTTLIATLNEEDGKSLLAEIAMLSCKRHFGDATRDYGEIIIYVHYQDGTAEVIGLCNVAQVDTSGKWHSGIEYFDAQQLCILIMKYVDNGQLPDLRQYFD